jgi:hypothetical protein
MPLTGLARKVLARAHLLPTAALDEQGKRIQTGSLMEREKLCAEY